ncbi:MAG: bifunctional riboflavin kinase/FMN adenylyltransferase [Gammaproteobacteria bacterium]|jgi:riboflavin kinase/FMN adenylyltransferase|nr:bifunctional riboflavin kinase/FMN adenylyltransferase [Gammaproteobacteria bacterium]|tara:strand:+ start:1757 stop:2698 length:942 start_codon:yes stop_codon:yes gene_type:complete
MEIIRGPTNLKEGHRGCVVTIGNFDGVHTGHQAILKQVKDKASELGVPSMLICFEPQPKEFFSAHLAPARLTRFREKVELLEACGIDLVFCLRFNEETRSISAQQFMDLLTNDIKVRALFVGDDFQFGYDRSGGFELLQSIGEQHGFPVTNLYTMTYESIRVSSTHIRECLFQGDFATAEEMLGHPYAITGKVVYGRQVGRTIGIPTANIHLHRYRAPIEGVYAVEVQGLDADYIGVANVGVRPTFEEEMLKPILEVHILDFNQDIYGRFVKVIFRHKVREEMKFDGIDQLKSAISNDIESARELFKDKFKDK